MAIDLQNNLLFVHIPKNAGKSVEVALGIISPQEAKSYAFRSPFNRLATYAQRRSSDPWVRQRLFGTLDVTLCAQHLTYLEISLLGLASPRRLATCFKFAVCRNPFDRIVSTYAHFVGPAGSISLDEFCETWFDSESTDHNVLAHQRTQTAFVVDQRGDVCMDEVLRFEDLNEEFERKVRPRFPHVRPLPVIGARQHRASYKDLHTPSTMRFVRDRFGADLESFSYDY